jgi:hypothetical protein
MLIYLDVFNQEEIISDSYDIVFKFNNAAGEVESKYIVVGEEKFDVGCGDAFGGAGDDEGADD